MRASIQDELTGWYHRVHRDLPWRRTSDPYAIWVSEIMLQQTQVETVKPYYLRFMETFPDVETLAASPLEKVLHLWAGLGYYSRARNLHRGAAVVVERFEGRLPPDINLIKTIPGIGPYTAGAILSIAFGIPAPILDGNVIRVLSRIFHLTDDSTTTSARAVLWDLASLLVHPDQPSAFNQAMMELGALVCVPGVPRCELCPLSHVCVAKSQGDAAELPTRGKEKVRPTQHVAAALITRGGRWLVCRRPEQGLLGGLWELPLLEVMSPDDPAGVQVAIQHALGLVVDVGERLDQVRHIFTHLDLSITPWRCTSRGGEVLLGVATPRRGVCTTYLEARWASQAELKQLPTGVIVRKLLAASSAPQLSLFSPSHEG